MNPPEIGFTRWNACGRLRGDGCPRARSRESGTAAPGGSQTPPWAIDGNVPCVGNSRRPKRRRSPHKRRIVGAPSRRPPCKNRNSPRPEAGNREEKTRPTRPQGSSELAPRSPRACPAAKTPSSPCRLESPPWKTVRVAGKLRCAHQRTHKVGSLLLPGGKGRAPRLYSKAS